MEKNRLEALSDGVLAIIITIMVLEFKTPGTADWAGLASILPSLLSYLLSFIYIGIYWNNHHHMIKLADGVSGGILWANLHLLFWLSLVPFMTRWMDESGFAVVPVFIYGVNLLLAAVAYAILQAGFIRQQGPGGRLAGALGRNVKARISPAIYIAGCALSFVSPAFGLAAYAVVAAIWLVPDRGMERMLQSGGD
ncbi:TMEM175 family protein [Arthrobacter sp. STN4]|uniref:TMEM175 family protein n=1 Tax=Arthrobacter sp. STN4 TaxID=2923276 RepID=UPI00211A7CE1|nr:TMEM175 family protein [Arthrobacter sp. STN4]MCQ9164794.1 TMEM175 family protein [Arthrobacter sp. STN4]